MKTLTTITTCDEDQFIQFSRRVARLIDQGSELPEESHIMFGDPADLLKLLRADNRALFSAIKDHPGSVSDIAEHLQRQPNAVQRDINELERFGIVAIEKRLIPDHGYVEEVHLTAKRFKLEADLI